MRRAALLVLGFVVAASGSTGLANAQEVTVPLPPEPDAFAIVSQLRPTGRANYVEIVRQEAGRQGMPAEIADAVVQVESGYRPGAVGAVGEIGLMQIRPSTAAMLGFRGTDAELFEPRTNIRLGVAYLAGAWRLAGGDLCTALSKYRAGHGVTRISPLSARYCARANALLTERGVDSDTLPRPAALALGSARQRSTDARAAGLRALFAQHAARVRQIESRISRLMGG